MLSLIPEVLKSGEIHMHQKEVDLFLPFFFSKKLCVI